MTVPYFEMGNNLALAALRFSQISMDTAFDPKINPMLCFGYFIGGTGPDSVSPVFQVRDKEQPDQLAAGFHFSAHEEKRFVAFVADTLSQKPHFKMVTPPSKELLESFTIAARASLAGSPDDDVRFELMFPHHLLMALLVSENYQFLALLSPQSDGKAVSMFLTIDHANCDTPVLFRLDCSDVGGHLLTDEEVSEEVDRIFGFPPPVNS